MGSENKDLGRSAEADGLSSQATEPLGVSALRASIPNAADLIQLMWDYQNIPSQMFQARYPVFCEARAAYKFRYRATPYEATLTTILALAEHMYEHPASAIEAGTGETRSGSIREADESAVATPDAPTPPSPYPSGD